MGPNIQLYVHPIKIVSLKQDLVVRENGFKDQLTDFHFVHIEMRAHDHGEVVFLIRISRQRRRRLQPR